MSFRKPDKKHQINLHLLPVFNNLLQTKLIIPSVFFALTALDSYDQLYKLITPNAIKYFYGHFQSFISVVVVLRHSPQNTGPAPKFNCNPSDNVGAAIRSHLLHPGPANWQGNNAGNTFITDLSHNHGQTHSPHISTTPLAKPAPKQSANDCTYLMKLFPS